MLNLSLVTLMVALFASAALASPPRSYKVVITNITPAQAFTPQLVVTHPVSTHLFVLGEPASAALEVLAESGDTGPQMDALANDAYDMQTIPGLLEPGDTSTVIVTGHPGHGRISIGAMLIPTNDTFVALDAARLPRTGRVTYLLQAYDAGTEYNDQNCDNIPGPPCFGVGSSDPSESEEEPDEGFVHMGSGFQELGDDVLSPHPYAWGSAVAKVVITRLTN